MNGWGISGRNVNLKKNRNSRTKKYSIHPKKYTRWA